MTHCNPDPCPCCRQPRMGAWRPLQGGSGPATGNDVESRCLACGARERRQLADAGITGARIRFDLHLGCIFERTE